MTCLMQMIAMLFALLDPLRRFAGAWRNSAPAGTARAQRLFSPDPPHGEEKDDEDSSATGPACRLRAERRGTGAVHHRNDGDTGGSAATTTPAPATGETSPSTGANTGSGSTSGTGTGSASGTPGNQSPNPNILGNSATGPERNLGGWGNTGFGGQPMMQGMMTCVSPAPMGGFGSFACYPAGWGMGSGMMDGWHDRMHYGPRDGRDQNRRRRTSDDAGGYDDDWRDGGSGYDDGTGTDDYSNP